MTTDRELLELAAKAAGLSVTGWNKRNSQRVAVLSDGSYWQPLLENSITDTDGDALRLAVRLKMVIDTDFNGGANAGNHNISFNEPEYGFQEGQGQSDLQAATRRAIVRAAAEIGRAMK